MQRVDGSILYDSFELSFNPDDKTSIVKTHNDNILQAVNNTAVAVNVYSKAEVDTGINLKADDTYLKAEVNVALSILQAGIDRRCLMNAVVGNGKFQINAVSNDMMKIQRIGGSLLYDALELSFNMADKTNIFVLTHNNVDSLESLNLKAIASNVYTNAAINANDISYDNALNTRADQSDSYTRAEIIKFIETQSSFNGSFMKIVDPVTGNV